MRQVSRQELIKQAKLGQVISFPTDTVNGLAVLPSLAGLIFALKKRSENKPLILMGAYSAQLWQYVTGTASEQKIWQEIAQKHWPGALTLVLPASSLLPSAMNPNGSKTIGLRIPSHPTTLEILSQTGPLATTSANLSKERPLENIEEISRVFPSVYTLKTINSSLCTGVPSTVAQWTGEGWQILRQGGVFL